MAAIEAAGAAGVVSLPFEESLCSTRICLTCVLLVGFWDAEAVVFDVEFAYFCNSSFFGTCKWFEILSSVTFMISSGLISGTLSFFGSIL